MKSNKLSKLALAAFLLASMPTAANAAKYCYKFGSSTCVTASNAGSGTANTGSGSSSGSSGSSGSGSSSGTITPPVVVEPVIEKLITVNGAKQWSDNSKSESCLKYLTGDSTHKYSATDGGNGAYWLNINGVDILTTCDMSAGGYTQVMNGNLDPSDFSGYPSATGSFGVVNSVSEISSKTWKMSDANINLLVKNAYRTQAFGGYSSTRYFKPTCVYKHTTVVSGDCATSYADETFSTANRKVGTESRGLSDNTGGRYFIITNNGVAWENSGWCGGDGSNGGCAKSGTRTGIKIWVK